MPIGGIIAAAIFLSSAVPAAAQTYPARPVKLVVGFLAGGPTDIPARFIADRLSTRLGQKVYVENKPGAGGMIALNDVLAQPADGYSLSFCTYFDAINTLLYKNVSYKLADIAPITLVSKYYYLMALAKSVPVDTFKELVSYAKAHPGDILYGTVGAGSTQELVAHELEKTAGIRMTKVPFKGANEITQEMLAGRVHFQVGPPIAIGSFYQSGKLKVLATTSPQRLKSFPDIPALTELGYPLTPYGWLGVCAKAGTPKPIVDLLNRHIVSIVQSDEYQRFLEKAGNIPVSDTPEEFGKVIADTVNDAAPFIREFHMQIQ
ncbi:MAG TPA: tripartite tricarboxylate transporter substrate binding protein [Xanthobacteraceae bacterium]|nr:tripartite tricarboxylate transporter substrate binding protein [Xanthobacteraceae bacterium]